MEAVIKTILRNSFPRAILLGLIGAIVAGSLVVYTNIQATDLTPSGGSGISLAVNTFTDDPEVTIDNSSLTIVSANTTAAGDSAPGVPVTGPSPYPAVNGILTADNYSYTFDMHETSAGDWATTTLDDFRIRVFGFDAAGPTSTLLSTLYADQASVDAGNIEGVTVTVDLTFNTAVYDNFDIIVDRQ